MDMQVKDGLARLRADIQNGAIAIFDVAIPGNLGRREMASSDDFGVIERSFF